MPIRSHVRSHPFLRGGSSREWLSYRGKDLQLAFSLLLEELLRLSLPEELELKKYRRPNYVSYRSSSIFLWNAIKHLYGCGSRIRTGDYEGMGLACYHCNIPPCPLPIASAESYRQGGGITSWTPQKNRQEKKRCLELVDGFEPPT